MIDEVYRKIEGFENKHRNKWVAQIKIKGKVNYLGSFVREQEAHLAYENKLITLKR